MAEGNWVAFLDADDWLEEDALEELCAFGEKQRADIVMASMENTGNPNNVFYRDVDTVFCGEEKPKFVADVLKPQTGAGFACGKIFKRALLAENKIFFNEALAAAEDAEFVFRTANAAERIAYIPKVGYHYWYNPNSAVRCYRTDYAQRYILAIDAVRQDMDDMGVWEQYREAFYSFVLYHLLLIAVNASFHPQSGKNMAEQLREFQKLLAENPFSEALQFIRYSDFSITRRAALLCIRTRFYLGVKMIAWVRHQQFRRIASRRVSV